MPSLVADPYTMLLRRQEHIARINEQSTMYNILDPILNIAARRKLSYNTWYSNTPIEGIATSVHGYADILSRMFDIRDPATMLMSTLRFFGDTFDLTSSLTIKPFLHSQQYGTTLGESYAVLTGARQYGGRYNYWFGDYNESIDWLPDNWAVNIIGEMAIDPSVWITLGVSIIPGMAGAGGKQATKLSTEMAKQTAIINSKTTTAQAKKAAAEALDRVTTSYASKFSRSHVSAFKDPVVSSKKIARANKALWQGNKKEYRRIMTAYAREGILHKHVDDLAILALYDKGVREIGAKSFYKMLVAYDNVERHIMKMLKTISPIRVTKKAGEAVWRKFKYADTSSDIEATRKILAEYDALESFDDVADIDMKKLEKEYQQTLQDLRNVMNAKDDKAYGEALENHRKVQEVYLKKKNYEEMQQNFKISEKTSKQIQQTKMQLEYQKTVVEKMEVDGKKPKQTIKGKRTEYGKAVRKQRDLQRRLDAQEEVLASVKDDINRGKNIQKSIRSILQNADSSKVNESIKGNAFNQSGYEKFLAELEDAKEELEKSVRHTAEYKAVRKKIRELEAAIKVYEEVQNVLRFAMQSDVTANYMVTLMSGANNTTVRRLILAMSKSHFDEYAKIALENKRLMDEAIQRFSKRQLNLEQLINKGRTDRPFFDDTTQKALEKNLIEEFLDAVDHISFRDKIAKLERNYTDTLDKESLDFAMMLQRRYTYDDLSADQGFLGGFIKELVVDITNVMRDVKQTKGLTTKDELLAEVNTIVRKMTNVLGDTPELARLYKSLNTLNNMLMGKETKGGNLLSTTEQLRRIGNTSEALFKQIDDVFEKYGISRNKNIKQTIAKLKELKIATKNKKHTDMESLIRDETGEFYQLRHIVLGDDIEALESLEASLAKATSDSEKAIIQQDIDKLTTTDLEIARLIKARLNTKHKNYIDLDSIIRYMGYVDKENHFLDGLNTIDYMMDLFKRYKMIQGEVRISAGAKLAAENSKEYADLVVNTYKNMQRMKKMLNEINPEYKKYLKFKELSETYKKYNRNTDKEVRNMLNLLQEFRAKIKNKDNRQIHAILHSQDGRFDKIHHLLNNEETAKLAKLRQDLQNAKTTEQKNIIQKQIQELETPDIEIAEIIKRQLTENYKDPNNVNNLIGILRQASKDHDFVVNTKSIITGSNVRDLDESILDNLFIQHTFAIDALRRYSEEMIPIDSLEYIEVEKLIGNFRKAVDAHVPMKPDEIIAFYGNLTEEVRYAAYKMFDDYLDIAKKAEYRINRITALSRKSKMSKDEMQEFLRLRQTMKQNLKDFLDYKNMHKIDSQIKQVEKLYKQLTDNVNIELTDENVHLLQAIIFRQEFQPIYHVMQNMHAANFLLGNQLKQTIDAMHRTINVLRDVKTTDKGQISSVPDVVHKYFNETFPNQTDIIKNPALRLETYLEHQFRIVQNDLERLQKSNIITNDHIRSNNTKKTENIFNIFLNSTEDKNQVDYMFAKKFYMETDEHAINTVVYNMHGDRYTGDVDFKNANLVFLDTETTGVEKDAKVFQVGIVKVMPNGDRETYNVYLDIGTDLPGHIKDLTGHKGSMYIDSLNTQNYKNNEEVQAFLSQLLDDNSVIVAHNATFDMRGFAQIFGDYGVRDIPVLDTLPLFRMQVAEQKTRLTQQIAEINKKNSVREARKQVKILEDREKELKQEIALVDYRLKKDLYKDETRIELIDDYYTIKAEHTHQYDIRKEAELARDKQEIVKDISYSEQDQKKWNLPPKKIIKQIRQAPNEEHLLREQKKYLLSRQEVKRTISAEELRNKDKELLNSLRKRQKDVVSEIDTLLTENTPSDKTLQYTIKQKQELEMLQTKLKYYDSFEKQKQEYLVNKLVSKERRQQIAKDLQKEMPNTTIQDHNAVYDAVMLEEILNNYTGDNKITHRMLPQLFKNYDIEKVSDLNNRSIGILSSDDVTILTDTLTNISKKTDTYYRKLKAISSSTEDAFVEEKLSRILIRIDDSLNVLKNKPTNINVKNLYAELDDAMDAVTDIENILRNIDSKEGTAAYFTSGFSDIEGAKELQKITEELMNVETLLENIHDRNDEILTAVFGDVRAQIVNNKIMNNFRLLSEYVNNEELHTVSKIFRGTVGDLTETNDKHVAEYFREIIMQHAKAQKYDTDVPYHKLLEKYRADNENSLTRFYDLIDDVDAYVDFNRKVYGSMYESLQAANPADKEKVRVGIAKVNEFMDKLERKYKQMVEDAKLSGKQITNNEFESQFNLLALDPDMSPLIDADLLRLKLHEYTGLDIMKQIHTFVKGRIDKYVSSGYDDMRLFLNIDTQTTHEFYYFFKNYLLDPLWEVTKVSHKSNTGEVISKSAPTFTRLEKVIQGALANLRKPLQEIKYENLNAPTYHLGAIHKHIENLKKGNFYEGFMTTAELVVRNEAQVVRLTKAGKQATKAHRLIYDVLDGLTTKPEQLNTFKTSQPTNDFAELLNNLVRTVVGDKDATASVYSRYFKKNQKLTRERTLRIELLDSLLNFSDNNETIKAYKNAMKAIEEWVTTSSYLKKAKDGSVDVEKATELMHRLKGSLWEFIQDVEPTRYKRALSNLYDQGFTKKELFASKLAAMKQMQDVANSTEYSYTFLRQHFGQGREGAERMYNFIRQNPEEYSIVQFEFNSNTRTGVGLRKLNIKSAEDILNIDKQLADTKASVNTVGIVDQNTFYKLQREVGQVFKFRRNGVADKIRRHYLMPLKSVMLANANFVFSNVFDAVLKNMLRQAGGFLSPRSVLVDTVRAAKMHKNYMDLFEDAKAMGMDYRTFKSKETMWVDVYAEHLKRTKRLTPDKERMLVEAKVVHQFLDEPAASGQFQEMLMNVEGAFIGKGKRTSDFEKAINTIFYGKGPLAWNMNLNSRVEIYSRLGLYLNDVEKGLAKNESLTKILKTHYNYVDKSQEELYAEFFIPFMSFPIRSFLFWADAFHDNPVQTKFLSKLITRSWGQEAISENDYARYQAARGRLPIGDQSVNLGLTWMDAMSAMGGREDFPVPFSDQAWRKLNPVAKNLMDTERPMGERISRMPGASQITAFNQATTAIQEGQATPDNVLPSMFNPYYARGGNRVHQQTTARHPQFRKPYSYNTGNIVPNASRSIRWRMTNLDRFKTPRT